MTAFSSIDLFQSLMESINSFNSLWLCAKFFALSGSVKGVLWLLCCRAFNWLALFCFNIPSILFFIFLSFTFLFWNCFINLCFSFCDKLLKIPPKGLPFNLVINCGSWLFTRAAFEGIWSLVSLSPVTALLSEVPKSTTSHSVTGFLAPVWGSIVGFGVPPFATSANSSSVTKVASFVSLVTGLPVFGSMISILPLAIITQGLTKPSK